MERGCVFCGGAPLTNEHILSRRWLHALSPGDAPWVHCHVREEKRIGVLDADWKSYEADVKVRCVCKPCNNGWMGALDRDAAPYVTRMANGQETVLATVEAQTILAVWATKIAMMCDHLQAVPVVEPRTTRAFGEKRMPVEGSTIRLARTRPEHSGKFNIGFRTVSKTNGPNALFCSIDVNCLVIQVFIPRSDTPKGWGFDRTRNVPFSRQLWPTSFMKIVWPPPGVVPPDMLTNFARGSHTTPGAEVSSDS